MSRSLPSGCRTKLAALAYKCGVLASLRAYGRLWVYYARITTINVR